MLNQSATLDRVFHALADPSRRGMVERLSRGPASVSELAQPLDITLAAVVQHLQVLEASGLVRSEKVGRVRTCRIEPAALRRAEQWIAERRTTWERRLDRLGDYLAERRRTPEERLLMSRHPRHLQSSSAPTTPPPARVFAALADPAVKAAGSPARPKELGDYELDFRVGGRERNRGGPPGAPMHIYDALLPRHRAGPAHRLLTYDDVPRRHANLGLAGDDRAQARRRRHAADVYRAGRLPRRPRRPDLREKGMGDLLDALGAYLGRTPASAR